MRRVAHAAVRWTARITAVLSITILASFFFGDEFGSPTAREWAALALFPGGVILGLALGWWREGLGAVVTLGSLAAFYLLLMVQGDAPRGPYFLLFASPGLLYAASWLLRPRRHTIAP